jgi:predicted cobalt transporter CbtA
MPGWPFLREEVLLVAEVDERVEPVHRHHPDVAAAPAVAAVGAAEFDELLAPEAHAARAAAAGADRDPGVVEEFHVTPPDGPAVAQSAPALKTDRCAAQSAR